MPLFDSGVPFVVVTLVSTPLLKTTALNAVSLVRKITSPVGVATPVTVLVNVTVSPKPEGLSEEARAADDTALSTVNGAVVALRSGNEALFD
ncbi:hypothetical protein [Pedosphaera parvula]|uniref:Uncharacterized protein n=1 Tax=Pedosphaera parvula (strain Ellin514) TaxID=320771 RepID=B9XHL6_PEDPL|nr:hypothetical protein [Pedosphaera parvula]EEF60594.1 hypothetical protein Cflav_PD6184 [Pedosphaera parvula Ellin514]